MRVIFHVDLDAFFVSVERVSNPALRGKPVIVGVRGVVACASYEARAYGVHSGIPLCQARRLCPSAIFVEGCFSRYREASQGFFAILSQFTPDMEEAGIDEAYLDMSGFELLYGSPRGTALRLKEQIRRELGITASVGIASSRLMAKIASDLAKPDGLLEVTGKERAFLSPLPVHLLPGVGPRTERVLRGLGVRNIGELASLSPSLLKHLFGAMGAVLHHHANGIDSSPVEAPPAARSISRSTTFERDTLDLGFLEAMLGYLSEHVGMELRHKKRLAHCVTLKLRYADFETLHRQRMLKGATDADGVIFQVGRELLAGLLCQRLKLVRLIGIGVSHLVGERQPSLWGDGERLRELNKAKDRLRGKYGFSILEQGRTFSLRKFFPVAREGYLLQTPALSR